jgi:hypothetical protein
MPVAVHQEQEDFIRRLDLFISRNYDKREDFANAIGIPKSTIDQYLGARKSMPKLTFFTKFLKVHSAADLAFVLTGKNEVGSQTVLQDPSATYLTGNGIDKLLDFFKSGELKVRIERD